MTILDKLKDALEHVRQYTDAVPRIGIILGTGLAKVVDEMEIGHEIEYESIPHFPTSTVESHNGRMLFGKFAGKDVVVMQGRFHYYEGYTMQQVTFPVRLMRELGVKTLLISNAAGGLNESFEKSDLMVISDHINLLPENPLTGPHFNELGPRFPDMSTPYDADLRKMAKELLKEAGQNVREGVYVSVPGPNLETKAEYRYLQMIGADAVGMSTVPEVLVAVQSQLRVFAVSVITDICHGDDIQPLTLAEVLAAADKAEPHLTALFEKMVQRI